MNESASQQLETDRYGIVIDDVIRKKLVGMSEEERAALDQRLRLAKAIIQLGPWRPSGGDSRHAKLDRLREILLAMRGVFEEAATESCRATADPSRPKSQARSRRGSKHAGLVTFE